MKIVNCKLKIRNRYYHLIIGAVLVVLIPLALITLQKPNKAFASWYDDNWLFRKAITVTVASSASDIKDLETLVAIDTATPIAASKMQSSCQDMRFTNQGGKLLPYYIDSGCNGASTKVWVLLDLVPKNTTTYTMYMYYGNPSAPAASDANKFNLFKGLVGYWPMNEGTGNISDASVNSNTGTVTIGATGTQTTTAQAWSNGSSGKYSSSLNFDGTDDQVSIGTLTGGYTNNVTVSAWVKHSTNADAWDDVLSGSCGDLLLTFSSDGTAQWGGQCNSPFSMISFAVSNNTWHLLTGTYNGTTASLYVDGALVASGIRSGSFTPSALYIGSAALNEFYGGQIDDVRIYNRALSAAEVSQLYNTPGNITTTANATVKPSTSFATEEKAPGPVAYWKFDDGTGTTAQDSTVNNNDGTLSGTTKPTWQAEDQCVAGKCLYFDGSTSYVAMASAPTTGTGSFSAFAWVRSNTSGTRQQIFMWGNDTVALDDGTWLFINTNNQLEVDLSNDVGATSTSTIADNKWHYVGAVNNAGTLQLYIDGKANGSSVSKSPNLGSTYKCIGTRCSAATTWLFKGFIDEPKIYNYARSAAQVLADYNSRGTSKGVSGRLNLGEGSTLSNGLVGYWKMDEASWNGTSGEVIDSSGNGKNGTSAGSATTAVGKFGNGGSFNGSTGYVSTSPASVTDWTISGWGKASSLSNTRNTIFGFNCYGCMNFKVQSSYIEVTADGNGYVDNAAILYTTNANTWYHYTISCSSSSNKATVYVDGTQVFYGNDSNFGCAQLGGGGSEFRIGLSRTASEAYAGTVDEVRIYNRALSSAEVSQLYNFAPGPKVELKMEEGSGTSANDTSTNARTGTLNGGSTWTQGKYGKGVKFNGASGSNVSVPDFSY